MKNLIILTESFPYVGGEQFLEAEILYWKDSNFDNVYILPRSRSGTPRNYPHEFRVLAGGPRKSKVTYALRALFSYYFAKEVFYIIKNREFFHWLSNFKEALRSTAIIFMEKKVLSVALKPLDDDINVSYSYWNAEAYYASCLLKKEGLINHVVSRAHGFDLYEERRRNSYMPLKRQFANSESYIYLLSSGAVKYYERVYRAELNKLEVARLGVDMPASTVDKTSGNNELRVLSLSYCVPIKQIDIIMSSLAEYAKENKDIIVIWKHIGGGPLYEKLKATSEEIMTMQANLIIEFVGLLEHSDVKRQLSSNYFDVFVNASKSEGIPVSIMEAMSYRIPAIAPDVGGISDLVNDSNGYLMPRVCSTDDIKKGIKKIYERSTVKNYRLNAYNFVAENFNSNINYPSFIKKIEKIAGINEK